MRYLTLLLTVFMMSSDLSAQDWANFGRFEADNARMGAPADGESRVVFMGDSITEAWSVLMPSFFEGRPYINRGISGQTTPQMLVRFRADVIDLDPAVVVILAGTNDIAGNTGPTTLKAIAGNIASMAELARANGIAVVISSVLPAFDYPWSPGLSPDTKIPALNELLEAYSTEEGFVYLNYFRAMTDGNNGMTEAYTTDGVHATEEGYHVMASMVEEAISAARSR